MSQSFAHGRGSTKNICPKCKRTVRLVTVEGKRVETDTEMISVVVSGKKQVDVAYRVHGELCDHHRIAAEKKAFIAAQRKSGAMTTPTYSLDRMPDCPPIADIRKLISGHYKDTEKAKTKDWKRSGIL